jgi:hypothetical protein
MFNIKSRASKAIAASMFVGLFVAATVSQVDWISQVKNKLVYDVREYNFRPQSPTGNIINGSNTKTLSPCPLGVNGSDANHFLRISGGVGTAEIALITGGTCVSGASSGTVIITASSAHSGAWTLGSATSGIQEAVQAAQTAALSTAAGARIMLPAGTIDTYAAVHVSGTGIYIQGQGMQVSNVSFHDTGTRNTFEFDSGLFNGISDLGIFSTNDGTNTTKTGGSVIALTSQSYFTAQNVQMYYVFYGVTATASGFTANNFNMRQLKPTVGKGIYIVSSGAFDNVINHLTIDSSVQYFAGIEIASSGYVAIDRSDIVHATYGLLIDPTTGEFANTVDVVASYFDNSYGSGILIAPNGSGLVTRVRFTDCWSSSALTAGVSVQATAPALVDGVSFIGHYSAFNTQQGFTFGGNVTNIEVLDSYAFGNSSASSGTYDGIAIGPDVTNVSIHNTVSGRYADAVNTQSRGLDIFPGTGNGFNITGNDFRNNVNGAMLDQTASSSTKIIANNLGIDSATPPTIASATSIAMPNTGQSVFFVSGTTTITSITLGRIGGSIRILKSDAGSVTIGGGGNIPGSHTLAQNGGLTLTYNGTAWY